MVVKETAQCIWSQAGLAARSVKGVLAPKKRNSGELPKPALTPEKVDIVKGEIASLNKMLSSAWHFAISFAATLSYWGTKKRVDVAAVAANLANILSEKIQIKVERRLLNQQDWESAMRDK